MTQSQWTWVDGSVPSADVIQWSTADDAIPIQSLYV
jgi:hypothetical protein